MFNLWEKQFRFTLELYKMYLESCLRIVDRELYNIKEDIKLSRKES